MDDRGSGVTRGDRLRAGASGLAAVALGAGLGELASAILLPAASPFASIGGALIDLAPSWAKDLAIGLFGTNDKAALLTGIALVLAAAAFGAGLLEHRRTHAGSAVFALFGVVGAAVAMGRTGMGPLAWVPSIVAGGVGFLVLRALIARLRPSPVGAGDDRRRFLIWTGATAALGVVALAAGSVVRAGARSLEAVRAALRLPAPAASAPSVPETAELGIEGLAPVVTPNRDFYRIDTALVVPRVDPADWSLRVHGMVEREVTLSWDELLAEPLQEADVTLACVSNPVGGDLIGNARWLGLPVRELLARAGIHADADMVLSRSVDGFTASTPLEALTDDRDALLAVGMNGEPLPIEHGFPVRLVVPGLYGYVSATKWVTELEVTRFDRATAYWTTRGWSERGPIKLQSRIDVPSRRRRTEPGETVIAGMAWQQHVGVGGVEVRVDGGAWRRAELATPISDDTWVQWSLPWTAEAGEHDVECRAIGADGDTQTEEIRPPAPDGAQGWHRIRVTVG
ncbi:molybdopterin-dependent oxidoreductase [Microbacterium sp. SD291]|uniref:molybdopterin-dependent oxidoreductase n=1 Tax=Microbacterium sp. SD291 TaxID=2782007 RepID=UPI001A976AE9|nr:molybdopterin-dependent oxidoreductase [Microbacterium sp. SD291]MBO0981281.1 molybdopterin-dependent oxidoreductase [Microbacterium sp. SD291]